MPYFSKKSQFSSRSELTRAELYGLGSKPRTLSMAGWYTRSLVAHDGSVSSHGASLHSRRNPTTVLFLVVWACSAILVASIDEQQRPYASVGYPLIPQSGKFGPQDVPAMWQLPNEGPVVGILVIYTPRTHHPGYYWDYSPSCLTCRGLPEQRNIVEDALSKKYAVFVPGHEKEDWEWWPEDNPDVLDTRSMITEWKDLLGLKGIPTVALGPSSGGYILSTAALLPGFFDAICLMCSHGVTEAIKASTHHYPPTVFVHMARDLTIAGEIEISKRSLDSRGVPTEEVKWYPHPLTPDWFSKSIIGVDVAFSNLVFNCVKREGWLDEGDFLNTHEYREIWDEVTSKWNIFPEGRRWQLLSDSILYELNVLYAQHVTISFRDDEIFAFFEEHSKSRNPAISSF